VTLVDDFRSVVAEGCQERIDAAELLPTVLAKACVDVLPVAGAGLSLTDSLRVPLGASDDAAARAERLQTSLGEGPCLAATDSAEPLIADLDGIAARWPVFHLQLMEQTPFRSVASLPLLWGHPRQRQGAVDLYMTRPDLPSLPIDVVAGDVADTIAEMLFASPPVVQRNGTSFPLWMTGPSAVQRMNVWLAAGMLIGHAGLSSGDAVAVMRAYAFGHSVTLDEVAEAMVTKSVDPEAVLGIG
jgi:hypothetical protein